MKTSLFAKQFIQILAQATSGDLAGGASKALGIVMLIGFIFGTICVVGGGFAIRPVIPTQESFRSLAVSSSPARP